ncbi:MAG TPA: nuclear transport factor 2 family protein [Bryobacteraceae bacterium]
MSIRRVLFFVAGFAALVAAAGLAQGQRERSATATAQTITAIERDWLNAEKTGDTAKLTEMIADDWVLLAANGTKVTKAEELRSLKSGESKISSYEMGPVDVKVIGNVAIAQGSDNEKSSYKGKTTSGKWLWMDVFVKRNGRWQAVRSQIARVTGHAANP